MKTLKLMTAVALVAGFSMVALADHRPDHHAEENFEKMKAGAVEMTEKRIKMLQDAQTCFKAATKKEDLKKCHEAMRDDRHEMREEMMKRREERKKERHEKMEEKK